MTSEEMAFEFCLRTLSDRESWQLRCLRMRVMFNGFFYCTKMAAFFLSELEANYINRWDVDLVRVKWSRFIYRTWLKRGPIFLHYYDD